MFSLDNKVALVVGGTSGIGKEISLGFAEAGATVIPVSRNIEKVNKTVEAILIIDPFLFFNIYFPTSIQHKKTLFKFVLMTESNSSSPKSSAGL